MTKTLTEIAVQMPVAGSVADPIGHDLVRRIARGDQQTFQAVYREWQGPIYRFAWHMTGNTAAAEELTQDTFLALIEKPSRFDPAKGNLGSYLFGIAKNLVSRRFRDERAGTESIDDEMDQSASVPDPWAALSQHELVETVRSAVVSLPLPYREAVALCDLEEMSYEAAAIALDCPVGTIRSRLSRGRLLLGMKLKEFARGHVDGMIYERR